MTCLRGWRLCAVATAAAAPVAALVEEIPERPSRLKARSRGRLKSLQWLFSRHRPDNPLQHRRDRIARNAQLRGIFFQIAVMVSTAVSLRKARCPETFRTKSFPGRKCQNAHPQARPFTCSGDIYPTVPKNRPCGGWHSFQCCAIISRSFRSCQLRQTEIENLYPAVARDKKHSPASGRGE